ncbi:hypothetical protein E5D57_001022 [Metarhizium anisopliae]|nr:hypothetical protein E5D57_001022 [Metarhizium anisopliae]
MSSSITIPTTRSSASPDAFHASSKILGGSSMSSYSSSPSRSSPSTSPNTKMLHTRRPSLLSSAISKQESTVINIGDPDGPPRLDSSGIQVRLLAFAHFKPLLVINTVRLEIFLPSYVDCDYVPLENQREPVHEIILSDEESRNMLPH